MSRFAVVLREINNRLDLPQPQKSRIVLEIASDMEAACQKYIDEGMPAEEAEAKAVEKFSMSSDALIDLVNVHESAFNKFLGTVSMQARSWWERAILAVLILFIALLSGRQIFSSRLLTDAGSFIWGVAFFSTAAVAAGACHAYRLYIRKEHDRKRLRKGLPVILLFGCGSILTGLLGSSIGIYLAITKSAIDNVLAARRLINGAISGSALLMASLVSATGIFIIWFIMMNKAWKIERAEFEWLTKIE